MPKFNKEYLTGISWFLLSLVISCLNDVITKYLGSSLHPMQIAFFRFFFGMISLLPFMLYYSKTSFQTSRPILHVIRGILLFSAISIWCFGLNFVPILSATLLTFTIPFFILILAPIFLQEKVGWQLWMATLLGFIGVALVLNPTKMDFNPLSFVMCLSATMFALLDIINKKFVIKESMLSMLFYSALVTSILSFYPALQVWSALKLNESILLFILGAGSNLILYCLLKCFSLVNASAVAPYRYLELVLSALFGFIIFREIPSFYTYVGAAIIIPTTLYIAYKQLESKI